MRLYEDDESIPMSLGENKDDFTEEEKDMVFSNPLDDPSLHIKCKNKELCNQERCAVYMYGSNIDDGLDSVMDELSEQ